MVGDPAGGLVLAEQHALLHRSLERQLNLPAGPAVGGSEVDDEAHYQPEHG